MWFMRYGRVRLMIGKAHGSGTFPKGGAIFNYYLILGTLFWE